MNWTRIRKQLGNRSAIVGAGVAGFVIGAGGFVAAQIDDSPAAEVETETSIAGPSITTAVPDTAAAGSDDPAPTSIDLTVPTVTVDDSSTSSIPTDTIDDNPTTSSAPTDTIDDNPTTSSAPTNTIDDDPTTSSVPANTIDDSSTSSVPAARPAAFSRTYQSTGGSIDVTWTGTAFVLNSISPAPGFAAEIEDQSWDRIRVDFEGAGDARIEVRLGDGQIRVRID